MMIVTTDYLPGREIKEVLGLVKGSTVQSKHIGKDLLAGLKTIVGGEIKEYTDMLNEARKKAIERMAEEARQLGADAIIAMRLQSSSVMQGASELIAYGTAVRAE
ncbi:YbjQ family protein [Paenibacillus sp. BSR1-1]|uniref:YbjQ family protein n=1 Tax=Paenibacillus sp. BSR1-1 TaxID=3020845 RepID=UPI0025B138CB|nr:YbjQ family protein [Paenibacillus sp. BSR1-1]MDN3015190.1 YbjQ family protein [Paenibacillus sp. BSR1-1]